jgi:hypothetical protein
MHIFSKPCGFSVEVFRDYINGAMILKLLNNTLPKLTICMRYCDAVFFIPRYKEPYKKTFFIFGVFKKIFFKFLAFSKNILKTSDICSFKLCI